uniref:Uncharacterized protein n=1 Tax=Siphoviridae sp. ctMYd37 TaxID=2826260 RepID=A0A8S5M4J7_9CAUD|nr:MAG TPA: hypothetical protein [Siphoviridae sp. ctMYd37]
MKSPGKVCKPLPRIFAFAAAMAMRTAAARLMRAAMFGLDLNDTQSTDMSRVSYEGNLIRPDG